MTKLKTIIIFILIITLNSCNNKSIKTETETYILEINKASNFQRDFINHIQKEPLNINAERINLKDIFGILIKTDTSNIKFKNDRMKDEHYSLLIEQKTEGQTINKAILKNILDNWSLKINVNKYKSYQIKIQDTLDYFNLITTSDNKISKVIKTKDSIKINNCDLTQLTEILNSEFPEQTIYNGESKRIDYSWKKTTFEKLKIQMQNDFGILFLDSKKDKSIFTIENN